MSIEELLPEKYKHLSDNLVKGTENFDTWFDSSCSWNYALQSNSSGTQEKKTEIVDIVNSKLQILGYDKIRQNLEEVFSSQSPNSDFDENSQTSLVEVDQQNSKLIEKRNLMIKRELKQRVSQIQAEGVNEGIKSLIPEDILLTYGREKTMVKRTHEIFPFDMCIEGTDQHNDWLLLSSLCSVAFRGEVPFSRIKTHGLISDEAGNKMSKNFVRSYLNPFDLTDGTVKMSGERKFGYGADTIRLWIVRNDLDKDIRITDKELELDRSRLKVFRQFAKFCIGNISDFDKAFEEKIYTLKFEDLEILEQILLYEYFNLLKIVDSNLENHNYRVICEEIFKFINDGFLHLFADSTKGLFLTLAKDSYERRSLQYILKDVFLNTLVLLSPIIPFNCEDAYDNCSFIDNKKPYLGFEEYRGFNYFSRKYEYKATEDFEFNIRNLIQIKKEFDKVFEKLNEMGLPKNKMEIFFEQADKKYENILLNSLKNRLSSYFGVAKCFFGEPTSNDGPKKKEIKKGKIAFFQTLDTKSGERYPVEISYSIYRSNNNKCIRCLLNKCDVGEQVCRDCIKEMKLLI